MMANNARVSLRTVKKLCRKNWLVERNWYLRLFARRISPYITYCLVNIGVTANQASVISLITGLIAAVLFGFTDNWLVFVSIFLLHLAHIFDCVDGEISRIRQTSSLSGGYLDIFCSLYLVVFQGAIFIRMYKYSSDFWYLILAPIMILISILGRYIYSLRYVTAGQELIKMQVINKGIDQADEIAGKEVRNDTYTYKLLEGIESIIGSIFNSSFNVTYYITCAAIVDYFWGEAIFRLTGFYLIGILAFLLLFSTIIVTATGLIKIVMFKETEDIFLKMVGRIKNS